MTGYLLDHLLDASAERYPDRPAIVDGERSLTYGELNQAATAYARLFVESGVQPGDRIAMYIDKSLEAVIAIYGSLKAGAIYVPLDARAPVSRLAYIASDCGTRFMVSGDRLSSRWSEMLDLGAPIETLFVPDIDEPASHPAGTRLLTTSDLERVGPATPLPTRIDEDLAYILYTSGSTGQPKGVMLSHRNGLAFVEWARTTLELTHEDRLSSHAPFHFDLSIFDLFATAAAGACVCLVPHGTSVFPVEVSRFISEREISVWYSVPSILSLLTQHGGLTPGSLPSLRHVVFAGEVFPSKYLASLMEQIPAARFHNWYGPTETNVCTAYTVPSVPDVEDGEIPIGRAIDNVETFVLGPDGTEVARGEEGELHVRGATVMHGYWGDAEKTASRLRHNSTGPGVDRVYATGDLVIERDSGDYRFKGRKDHQIKSRGYRIELGEIETAINAHPAVVEAVVIAVPDDVVTNRIKACVVADDSVDGATLARWCAGRIPKYMIPEHFEFLGVLPKTSTGKIDRQAAKSLV